MKRTRLTGTILTLVLIGWAFSLGIHPAMASETIYIRADGTVDPPTAPIQRDGDTYTLTDNIQFLSIVVERNNSLIDGNKHTLQGIGYPDKGLILHQTSNVTVENFEIQRYGFGIIIEDSSNNIIWNNSIGYNRVGAYLMRSHDCLINGNNITANGDGIELGDGVGLIGSSSNVISGNNITKNSRGIRRYWPSNNNIISGNDIEYNGDGISFAGSSGELAGNNTVFGNEITGNSYGISLTSCSGDVVSGNNIIRNMNGIRLTFSSNNNISENNIIDNERPISPTLGYGIGLWGSSNNSIYHNNFINNSLQIYDESWKYTYIPPSVNTWDDGYPSGGNYWSDYAEKYPDAQELDDSGIWDTPYVIDQNNQDNYPLMEPWTPAPTVVAATLEIEPDTLNLGGKGKWITVYIQLPESYDPAAIDASKILLNETIAPVLDPKYGFVTNSSEYLVDYNNDGIIERMIKFDRVAVQSLIIGQGISNGNAALTATGKLSDGTQFEGTDTIFVNQALRLYYRR